MLNRRDFLKQSSLALGLSTIASPLLAMPKRKETLEVHIFSKHLQFLSYEDAAAAAKHIGFNGVELTVRPGGHVRPEKVETDLPRALAAIRNQGLKANMIVTAINDIDLETNQKVLEVASQQGIKTYRLGYYRYPEKGSLPDALESFNQKAKALAAFNAKLGLQGQYQNHAGKYVGASMWEVWQLLEGIPTEQLASQYDIRHALVEGGTSWEMGLRLIKDKIGSIVVKDFKWEKVEGKWKLVNVPLGEGMVDFVQYFKLLKEYGIHVPATLHLEYPIEGVEHGQRYLKPDQYLKVFEAMKKDLKQLKEFWNLA